MSQLTISSLFSQAAKQLRAEFEVIRATNPHSAEKGQEVEGILKKFLNNHLPQRFRAGSGVIIDYENRLSRQMDVIVYDALSSPIYRAAEKTMIIPSHTVAATIEVKTSLNKAELTDAFAKIASSKQLRKGTLTNADQLSTTSGASTMGTLGVIFGFDADTSLEALADNLAELNGQYDSSLWPEMVVVLDRGVIGYAISYPGQEDMAGAFLGQPPPGEDKYTPAPWYIHMLIYPEGELSLNRFFLMLLAHLTFYPYRQGPPPFHVMLQGSSQQALTNGAYQFDSNRRLRPVPEELYFHTNPLAPLSMEILSPEGQRIWEVQYIPWQDAAVIRAFGELPIEPFLGLFITDPRVQVVRHPGLNMQVTTLLKLTEEQFRQWPEILEVRSNMTARILDSSSST